MVAKRILNKSLTSDRLQIRNLFVVRPLQDMIDECPPAFTRRSLLDPASPGDIELYTRLFTPPDQSVLEFGYTKSSRHKGTHRDAQTRGLP